MTTLTSAPIDAGSPAYWADRQRAVRLIRAAEAAAQRLAEAPMYLHGGYDADGDVIPIDDHGPFDDMEEAIRDIEADPTAVSILIAQRLTSIGGYPVWSVIFALRNI